MKIKRDLLVQLIRWKDSSSRMPLMVNGVRQCGKTWLLKEFGKKYFDNLAYFNFEETPAIAAFFEDDLKIDRIITALSAFVGEAIHKQTTLIFFDEIQLCPKALNSLKYFCENGSDYAVVAAGSLLGVTLASRNNAGFPVGKVEFLELLPCSFGEYLNAVDPMLAEYCTTLPLQNLAEPFTLKLTRYFREYLAVGGMPAVVNAFLESHDWEEVDKQLRTIRDSYLLDFSKHTTSIAEREKLFLLWDSIPEQLGRGNSRFFYGEVKEKARARDLEDCLNWLVNASIVNRVELVPTPQMPLLAHRERKIFKVYMADTGLLRFISKLPPAAILGNEDIFSEFKGRFVENYVQQQLIALGFSPICYWSSGSQAEVDFLIQDNTDIIPVEVKSGLNNNAKSLKLYRKSYNPAISIRTSLLNLKLDCELLNIPLYLIMQLRRMLSLARQISIEHE